MPKVPKIMEDRIQEETPYHENTKLARRLSGGVRKHERRGVI